MGNGGSLVTNNLNVKKAQAMKNPFSNILGKNAKIQSDEKSNFKYGTSYGNQDAQFMGYDIGIETGINIVGDSEKNIEFNDAEYQNLIGKFGKIGAGQGIGFDANFKSGLDQVGQSYGDCGLESYGADPMGQDYDVGLVDQNLNGQIVAGGEGGGIFRDKTNTQ